MSRAIFVCLSITFLLTLQGSLFAQTAASHPEALLTETELAAHLRFLASDELAGRRTGSVGNNVAARYIAEQFRAFGLTPPPGYKDFFQPVPFEVTQAVASGTLRWGRVNFNQGDDMLIFRGEAAEIEAAAIFVGQGWVDEATDHDDYKDLDVQGKIVVINTGIPDSDGAFDAFEAINRKRALAEERGAVAVVENYTLSFAWPFLMRFMKRERMRLAEEKSGSQIPYCWVKDEGSDLVRTLRKGKKTVKLSLQHSGVQQRRIYSNNVVGIIEGKDPELKDEYIVLTAHFDHVGVGRQGGRKYTAEDSIYNGSRDNAMGTTALLAAAKALTLQRPARSIICLAVTGEELGLYGSQYYAEHPAISLNQTVWNLNTDGAGYNDTSVITVIGFGRTGTDEELTAAARAYGLGVVPNPMPKQNLFDRSDNVSFAAKGVPATDLSPGGTEMNAELRKYYHQPADNPETIDFAYLHRYCQTFVYAARLIANRSERPWWIEGDKYEALGKKLYRK